MEPYLSFFIAGLVGLFLAGLTFWFARKSGLQPAQAALIDTLKDNVDAQEDQIRLLKGDLAVERTARQGLEEKVQRLQAVVVELVTENAELRKKAGLPVKGVEL